MNRQSLHGDTVGIARAAQSERRTLPHVLYVVNVNPTDKFGSAEEQIVTLHDAFREEGSRLVPLFTFPPGPGMTDGFHARGVEAHCIDLRTFRWSRLKALRSLIRRREIDVVNWHFTEPLTNPYVWWLSLLNPKVRHFYTDHISRPAAPYAPPIGFRRLLKRLLLKRYARTLSVSRFVKDCLEEQGAWSNVIVHAHFVNTDRFVPNPAVRAATRRQYQVEDRFVVIAIAQMIPEKGIDVLLRAMTHLPDRAMLWLVGAGRQAEELQALSRILGVSERVRFLGLQRRVEPFLQSADCFVLPSRWKEAAGLVLLEAQSAGLPAVASRIGGIPEYVDEGRSGFLFTPEDAQDLARHLRALCDDPELCRRMGQQARAHAVENFSPAAQLASWLDHYR
jgi:glycosyltransferase involved in cell wall biosynthesis